MAQAKACPCCGTVARGELPGHVRARASYGPEVHAQAANLACGHHVPRRAGGAAAGPAGRGGGLAGVDGRDPRQGRRADRGQRVRRAGCGTCCGQAPALFADETPARAAGGLRYVHLACTAYLTLMHTGDRSGEAIDAGGVLPGYAGHPGPGRLPRLCPPHGRGARLVRRAPAARPQGPARRRAGHRAMGREDSLPAAMGPRRRGRRPRRRPGRAGPRRPGPADHPLPAGRRRRAQGQQVPARRHRPGRRPPRPPAPALRGHDPALRHPP